jgi:hypothetical protein
MAGFLDITEDKRGLSVWVEGGIEFLKAVEWGSVAYLVLFQTPLTALPDAIFAKKLDMVRAWTIIA